MRSIEEKTIHQLKAHFYIYVAMVAVFFLLALFDVFPFTQNPQLNNLAVQQYAIILTLIAIPAALKLFAVKFKKIDKTDKIFAIQEYKKIYFLRLYIIGFATLANIVLFALTRNNNFMWLAVISLVIYAFCKPSADEIYSLAETDTKQTEQEQI